jgi:hypothetical protein
MSQAEHDGEAEVLAKFSAYKARLEQEMGGDSAGRANPTQVECDRVRNES